MKMRSLERTVREFSKIKWYEIPTVQRNILYLIRINIDNMKKGNH